MIEGLDKVSVITAGNWLEETELPEHVVILGSGSTGLEMSQFYSRMGSSVTVVDRNAQVAPDEDEDIATALQRSLAAEGIGFHLHAEVTRVEPDDGGLTLALEGDAPTHIRASHLFVATGRRPNTDDLGLETVGVEVSDDGIVTADARLSTSVQGIWVAGDVRGGPMFTHTAWDDHRVLESQIAGDGSRATARAVRLTSACSRRRPMNPEPPRLKPRVKQDAIPGLTIPIWFVPTVTTAEMRTRTGNAEFQYEIACAQLCGLGHSVMRGFVTVQTAEEFQKWMEEKVKEQSEPDPFR